jgi:serpin B
MGIRDFNAYLAEIGAGWYLEMAVEDTATDPGVALEKIQKMHQAGITAVLGPMTSGNVNGVKGYADQNGMLVLSPTSSASSLAIPGDSVYRLVPDDSVSGSALSRLAEHMGVEALVPIWRGDTHGDSLWSVVSDDFESRGGTIHAGVRYWHNTSNIELEVELLDKNVREAMDLYGPGRVAVLMVSYDEYTAISEAAAGYDALGEVIWFASESSTLTDALDDNAAAAEFAESVALTGVQTMSTRGGEYERLAAELADQLGRDTSTIFPHTYDSAWVLGLSILQANSTDAAHIRDVLPGVAAGYSGALLSTTLNEAGDMLPTDYRIVRVAGGDWNAIGNYSTTTGIIMLEEVPPPEIPPETAAAINGFASNFYREVSNNDNLFFSPASIYVAFGMVNEGARGETALQLRDAFGFEADVELRHDHTDQLMSSLNQRDPHATLRMANAMWLAEWFAPHESYADVIQDIYRAEVDSVDLPAVGVDLVNAWANENTEGKIKNVLGPDPLPDNTASVMTNAIYFQGSWAEQFPAEATRPSDFWTGERHAQADFMRMTGWFDYASSPTQQVLRMPYEGDRLSMLVVLPTARDGMDMLEGSIMPDMVERWTADLRPTEVAVEIPKFEMETHYDMVPPLMELGAVDVFDGEVADLSGMADLSGSSQNLYVGGALHDAYVQVNEEGTEAAAVTTIIVGITSESHEPPPVPFVADHPFLFLILDDRSGTILFMGHVSDPSQ